MDPHTQWNTAADYYDAHMGKHGDTRNNTIIRPALMSILGDINDMSILDAGCGSGYFSAELAQDARQVTGIDFSEQFIHICRRKYSTIPNLTFTVADMTRELPFGENAFDVVVSKMVLHYVPEIGTFYRESLRVLKTGGKLLIAVDHPMHTQFLYAQELAGKKDSKYTNLRDYYSAEPSQKASVFGSVTLTWYPRTIGTYINACTTSGFRLEAVHELPETEHGTVVPRILIIVCRKT